MADIIALPPRKVTPDDEQRFEAYVMFRNDGASMSERQWQEHLKEPAFREWCKRRGLV